MVTLDSILTTKGNKGEILLDLLKTVHINQEEFPEKEVISMDLVCSREIPSGTSSSLPTRSNCEAEKFPGKNEGNILNPACSSQSEEILPDENVTPKKLLPVMLDSILTTCYCVKVQPTPGYTNHKTDGIPFKNRNSRNHPKKQ